ncbi:archease [Pyrofollis japonicus]|uniref:archease n=1 Tax=Pyrofollis japonicus TaxID=3060460 RepID=UPI00295B75D2|nr:archease [Pyrofollis japonicus]BEP17796.1 archease [Pyrofollis japonicus]
MAEVTENILEELRKVIAETPCPGWAHAPHPADVIIVAKGRTIEEAFEQAAIGVYEVITDTSKVEPLEERSIEDEGEDLEQLLYRWIEDLLFYTDSEGLVFSKFKVEPIEKAADEQGNLILRLRAKAWGEKLTPGKHPTRTVVKAMTYAMMEIVKENGCWRVQFVVDI